MTAGADWYRSGRTEPPADLVRPSAKRRVRHWLRERLPDPPVRGRTMVLYCRQGLRRNSAWAGMFSELFSVLGALHYGEARGAAAVRLDFRSPHYVDPSRGPNWWSYFFERDVLRLAATSDPREIHLNSPVSKYGKFGGFGDRVNGLTPHLYPMTSGVPREELHRLVRTHIAVRCEIRAKADAFRASAFGDGTYVIGIHYRGTDTARHFPFYRIPYEAFANEVRRTLEWAAPRAFMVYVATDERDFVDYMDREFPGRTAYAADAPRVAPTDLPIHFNRALPVSGYVKGESALVDCLVLAGTDYLVKGRSSLSDASLLFNPALQYSFCIR